MKCQQFSRRLGVSQQWCVCFLIYEGKEEANESCKRFSPMLEMSSSLWAWHGGSWVISISCRAENSSLPLLPLPPCSLLLKNIVCLQVKCHKCFRRVLVLDCLLCRVVLEFLSCNADGGVTQGCWSNICHSSFLHPLPLRIKIEELCSYCPATNLVNNKWWS